MLLHTKYLIYKGVLDTRVVPGRCRRLVTGVSLFIAAILGVVDLSLQMASYRCILLLVALSSREREINGSRRFQIYPSITRGIYCVSESDRAGESVTVTFVGLMFRSMMHVFVATCLRPTLVELPEKVVGQNTAAREREREGHREIYISRLNPSSAPRLLDSIAVPAVERLYVRVVYKDAVPLLQTECLFASNVHSILEIRLRHCAQGAHAVVWPRVSFLSAPPLMKGFPAGHLCSRYCKRSKAVRRAENQR